MHHRLDIGREEQAVCPGEGEPQALVKGVRRMRHRHADPNGSGRPETNVAVEFEADGLLDDPALLVDAHAAAAVENRSTVAGLTPAERATSAAVTFFPIADYRSREPAPSNDNDEISSRACLRAITLGSHFGAIRTRETPNVRRRNFIRSAAST